MTASDIRRHLHPRKLGGLAIIASGYCAAGLLIGCYGEANRTGADIVNSIFTLCGAAEWWRVDLRQRTGRDWTGPVPMLAVLPGPWVMLSVYLLQSRGIRGVLLILIAAVFAMFMFLLEVSFSAVGLLIRRSADGPL